MTAPHGHKFDPAHRGHLRSPERARLLPPREILSRFPLARGMAAVDVGCGTGHFTLPMAGIVGASGRVYAVDVSREMLEDLRKRVDEKPELPVRILVSTEERIPLPARAVDFAFMACVLHELWGPGTLREVVRILRPGGALGVVDWKKERDELGPPYAHRLSARKAVAVLREAGFATEPAFDATAHHYGILARPVPPAP